MDTIVFCQEELDNAVLQGCGHIGLCDGKFSLGTQGGYPIYGDRQSKRVHSHNKRGGA